ncbi:hypothetical protein BN2475_100155 [Paraburkholderia ribeironis]|uniref:Uncharacterized protein n=1 Tax=Paraburkholderia ribeironis TaxID=1247936 RepID=A0A1N7RR52_9BURK|nr:hypothetical protein BN2475_100155 [Paraburkholderia ribeironis]
MTTAATRTTRIGWLATAMACMCGGRRSRRSLPASACRRVCNIGCPILRSRRRAASPHSMRWTPCRMSMKPGATGTGISCISILAARLPCRTRARGRGPKAAMIRCRWRSPTARNRAPILAACMRWITPSCGAPSLRRRRMVANRLLVVRVRSSTRSPVASRVGFSPCASRLVSNRTQFSTHRQGQADHSASHPVSRYCLSQTNPPLSLAALSLTHPVHSGNG